MKRGYPRNLIDSAITKVSSITQTNSLQYQSKTKTMDRTPFVITRNPGNPSPAEWLKKYIPVLHSSSRIEWERQHHRHLSWVKGIATTWERCWCRSNTLHRSRMSQNKTRKQRDALSVRKNASAAKNIWSKPPPSAVSKPKRHSPSGTTWSALPATLYTWLTVLSAGLYSTWGTPEIPANPILSSQIRHQNQQKHFSGKAFQRQWPHTGWSKTHSYREN